MRISSNQSKAGKRSRCIGTYSRGCATVSSLADKPGVRGDILSLAVTIRNRTRRFRGRPKCTTTMTASRACFPISSEGMTPSSRPSHKGYSSSNVTEGRRTSIDQSRPFSTASTCLASVGGQSPVSEVILLAYISSVAGIRVLIGQHIALNRLEPHEVGAFLCRNRIRCADC